MRLLLILNGEGSTLFDRAFATGESGSRELMGPLPLSLHQVRFTPWGACLIVRIFP
jgi:hypothetical protein